MCCFFLFVVRCLSLVAYLFVVLLMCGSWCVVRCLLCVDCCLVVCWLLIGVFVVCGLMFVACCLLLDVCNRLVWSFACLFAC